MEKAINSIVFERISKVRGIIMEVHRETDVGIAKTRNPFPADVSDSAGSSSKKREIAVNTAGMTHGSSRDEETPLLCNEKICPWG